MGLIERTPACKQQWRRPAWASVQSDQHLCYSISGKYSIQTVYTKNFSILASLCNCVRWFESNLVGNPKDRFSHVTAEITSGLTGNLKIILSGLKLRVCAKKMIFLFLNQNICCGYSKEPSEWNHLNETVLLSTQNICRN